MFTVHNSTPPSRCSADRCDETFVWHFCLTTQCLPRHKWENHIKVGNGVKGAGWVHLARDKVQWNDLVILVMNFHVLWRRDISWPACTEKGVLRLSQSVKLRLLWKKIITKFCVSCFPAWRNGWDRDAEYSRRYVALQLLLSGGISV